jgi:hypothetical protein
MAENARKTIKVIFAISDATPTMPLKPRIPVKTAIIRKRIVQFSIVPSPSPPPGLCTDRHDRIFSPIECSFVMGSEWLVIFMIEICDGSTSDRLSPSRMEGDRGFAR